MLPLVVRDLGVNNNINIMTKADVITEIVTKTGIEKNDVSETVEAFFYVIKNNSKKIGNQQKIPQQLNFPLKQNLLIYFFVCF